MCLRIFALILLLALLFLLPCHHECFAEEEEEARKGIGFWMRRGIAASEIESKLFTHLLCGSFHISSFSSFNISLQKFPQHLATFSSAVKQNNPSLKTILSITGHKALSFMMSNASSRKIFIRSSFNVAAMHGFDGVDFYWRTYKIPFLNQSDMNNMATFLQEWRKAANKHFILTATLPFSPNQASSSVMFPVESMQANLNWVHVRTFEYSKPSNSPGVTAASSALYDPSNERMSTDYFVRQWIQCGLSASKLVMGLPLFGFSWNLTDPRRDSIGAPASGSGKSPEDDGIISYKQIKAQIQRSGGNSRYNARYVANYWSQGHTWISFDGVEAIREKLSYANKNKLLGYCLWQVYDDDNWELSSAAAKIWLDDRPRKNDKLKIIFSTVMASVLLCGAIIIILIVWARKFKVVKEIETVENLCGSIDLRIFSFSDIEEATDRFSIENKIGEGGFGLVFKGILPNDEKIAVKRRSKGSKQGFEEFKTEITLAARLQHVNLVRLLGFCIDREEQMLVYEYMPNNSLDFHLFDPKKQHLLDWRQRVGIIEGVTQGLLYLQEYSRLTILHRDLKVSNILLDHEMKPKIADFGMATPFQKDVHESTNGFVGTYGYISPEYVKKGLCSTKSDVYSFGVLLLQIISGRRISEVYGENNDLNLLEYAYKLWEEGKGMEFVEGSLDDTSSHCKLMTCLQVALLCVQNKAQDRPSMLQVSSMLFRFEGDNNNIAAPKQPAYSKLENEGEATILVNNSDTYSQNETTMSPVLAR